MEQGTREEVLITGASSGLGVEFAKLWAAKGAKLVLVARSGQPMRELAASLKAAHGTECLVLTHDLSHPGAARSLWAEIEALGWQPSVVVNNAGFGWNGAFNRQEPEAIEAMLRLNIEALTSLCRAALPSMLARGRGGILNLASVAGLMPGPWMASYYASKAYVVSFSEALHEECRGKGVSVTALCPGPTSTGFERAAGLEGSGLFKRMPMMGAAEVARQGYEALAAGRRRHVAGSFNRQGAFLAWLLPQGLVLRAVAWLQNPAK